MCSNHGKAWLRGSMIGKGSFGSVYKATLKKPRSRYSCFPSIMAVKSAEVSASGSLQKEREVLCSFYGSSNVIQCFGEEITVGDNGEMVYNLLLEYASGGTLADVIKKTNDGSGLPESMVRCLTKSILKGILDVHRLGYVHCDLKPENILLVRSSGGFVAKIGDFGSAKKVKQKSRKRKFDPYLRGTALYMAPEAWTDGVQEPPCDIWALGCTVLEMLTGKPAWQRKPDDDVDSLKKQIGYGFELPKFPTGISDEAKAFLKGCLVRKSMFRLMAEMLLDHPFMEGVDEIVDGLQVDEVAETVGSLVTLPDSDEQYCSSFCSDEPIAESDEDSCFSSYSDDEEEISFEVNDGEFDEQLKSGGLHPTTAVQERV